MDLPPLMFDAALARHAALLADADALRAQGDLTGALGRYRAADDVLQAIPEPERAAPRALAALALTQQRLAEVLTAQGDLAAVLDALRAELAMRRRIADMDGEDAASRDAVAAVAARVAEVLVLKSAIAAFQGQQAGASARRRPGEEIGRASCR